MTGKLGRVLSVHELAAYEAGRDDAAADIARMLNDEMREHLDRSGIPRSTWVINYDNAILQARGMEA